MKHVSTVVTILLLMATTKLIAQIHLKFLEESKTKDFHEIVQKVEEYYKDKDKGRGSGYKQFKRWEYYNSSRLSPDGKVVDVAQRNFNEFYYYQEKQASKPGLLGGYLAGAWESVGPENYSMIGGGYSAGLGRVNCVAVDPDYPDKIYVGTPSGGLWKSMDGGNTWIPLTDGLPRIGVTDIVIDPRSPVYARTIYILTGDGDGMETPSLGVFKSVNDGWTWYSTGLTSSDLRKPSHIVMHPQKSNELYVSCDTKLYKTEDGGLSWEVIKSDDHYSTFYDIEFLPESSDHMVISISGAIHFSKDAGATWMQSTSLPRGTGRIELAVTPAQPNYVYAVCGGGNNTPGMFNGLYRSTDGGATFELMSNTPNILGNEYDAYNQSLYDLAIAVSPTDPDEVHVGGIDCWKSLDGGKTWEPTSYWVNWGENDGDYTHADIHDLMYSGNTIYCGSDGGIYKSTDKAENWASISDGLQITQIYKMGLGTYKSEEAVYFGAQDNGLNMYQYSTDKSGQWYGGDGFESINIQLGDGLEGALGTVQYGEMFYYEINSEEVHRVKTYDVDDNGAWSTPFESIQRSPSEVLIRVGYSDIFEFTISKDSGKAVISPLTDISNGNITDGYCRHVVTAPSDSDYIYVAKSPNWENQSEQIFRTTDGGATWNDISANLPKSLNIPINYITVHPTDPNTVFVVMSGFEEGNKVFRTTNGGESWENISGSLPNVSANCMVFVENSPFNSLYVGMDVGVFYRDDNLSDWVPFYFNMPNVEVTELEINKRRNRIVASSYGRGIWESYLFGMTCEDSSAIAKIMDGVNYFTGNDKEYTSTIQGEGVDHNSSKEIKRLKDGGNSGLQIKNTEECDSRARKETKMGAYGGPLENTLGVLSTSFPEGSVDKDLIIFPNPCLINSPTYIQYSLDIDKNVEVQVYNLEGRLMYRKDNGATAHGKHVDKINISKLPAGVYIVKLIMDDVQYQSKISIIE